METKLDKETGVIVDELKQITDFTNSKGFAIIQERLFNKIALLTDVGDLPDDMSPDSLVIEIRARKKAITLIHDWWKEDVIGSKNQLESVTTSYNSKPWLINEQ